MPATAKKAMPKNLFVPPNAFTSEKYKYFFPSNLYTSKLLSIIIV